MLLVLKNWYIILTIAVVSIGGAYIYLHKQQELYESRMQILLKSEETYDYQNNLLKGLGVQNSVYGNYERIASQMRVVKSTSILNDVLDRLNLDVSYFIRGRVKTAEVFEHLPFTVSSNNYGANAVRDFNLKILDLENYELQYEVNEQQFVSSHRFGELVANEHVYLTISRNSNLNNITVRTLKDIDYAFKINARSALLGKYGSSLQVSNIDYTSIIVISVRDNIPKRAQMFLDSLGKVYIENSLQNKIEVNENTLRYIDKQISEVTEYINQIGSEIEQYKNSKSILNLTKEEETYFNRLVNTEQELKTLEVQLNSLGDLTKYVSGLRKDDVSLPPTLLLQGDDKALSAMIDKLYSLHLGRLRALDDVKTGNPAYENIVRDIEATRQEILKYLDSYATALQERIAISKSEIRDLEGKIKYIPRTHRELLNIERRLHVNEELYSFLLSRRAETIIARAAILPETRIIEEPRSGGIVYPERQKVLGRWLLIGLVIGLGISLLKIFTIEKVETLDALSSITNLSILGIAPALKEDSKYLFDEENSRSALYEAFRSLRANLEFLGSQDSKKRILITSLQPSEGKTFTSVNLSYILSRTQNKVLLVDCDLHKPKVADVYKIGNSKGLSNLLSSQAKFEDHVHHFDEYLDILTAGPLPPNASELIASPAFSAFLDSIDNQYEYIIIDTPPIGLITDTLVMMKMVDVKLFVMSSNFTTRNTIRQIEQIIERSELDNTAVILNKAKPSFSRFYYGKQMYYYGGSYGTYGSDTNS